MIKLNRLLQSPFTLNEGMHARIEREMAHAEAGRPARLIAKMNALVEPEIIKKLYAASAAGVKIELLVRGMCSLRPGVPGLSENITVRSIIGRFLEHHRVIYFLNNGEEEIWLSSADWMERNLFRRVEIAFPVLDKALRARLLQQLEAYVLDTAQSWQLQPDGRYLRLETANDVVPVQQQLMDEAI